RRRRRRVLGRPRAAADGARAPRASGRGRGSSGTLADVPGVDRAAPGALVRRGRPDARGPCRPDGGAGLRCRCSGPRPHPGLGALRGYTRRRLWFLGMLEPLLVLVAAVPLGVVGGYLAARALAARWLVPGLPVPFEVASGIAVLGVVVVTGVVAALVVRDSVN